MDGKINKISKVECEEASNRDAEGLRLGVGRGLRESHMREGGNCILKDGAALAHGDWLEDSRAMAMKGAAGETIARGIFEAADVNIYTLGKGAP